MDLRGRSERIVSVASDGARTRYQQRLGCLSRNRVGALHQLGWYRRMQVLSQSDWGRAFLFAEKEWSECTTDDGGAAPHSAGRPAFPES